MPQLVNIGVVIPAYRNEDFVAFTVASLLAQTFTGWRCAFVDDGSPDDVTAAAVAAASGDGRFTFVVQENAGVSGARMRGLAELGEWPDAVLFLDSDDTLFPTALARLSEALENNSEVSAVCGQVCFVDVDGARLGHSARGTGNELFGVAETFYENPCPSGSGWLYRRTVLEQEGGWNPDFEPVEDWHLINRIAGKDPVLRIPVDVVNYRRHPGAITHSFGAGGYEAVRQMRIDIYARASVDERSHLRHAWRRIHRERMRAALAQRQPKDMVKHALLVAVSRPVTLPPWARRPAARATR